MSTDDKPPAYGQDEGTQDMIAKAREDYPNLEINDAIQMEADKGPGREAEVGEGTAATSVTEAVKSGLSSVAETSKEANPATRDMTEKHC